MSWILHPSNWGHWRNQPCCVLHIQHWSNLFFQIGAKNHVYPQCLPLSSHNLFQRLSFAGHKPRISPVVANATHWVHMDHLYAIGFLTLDAYWHLFKMACTESTFIILNVIQCLTPITSPMLHNEVTLLTSPMPHNEVTSSMPHNEVTPITSQCLTMKSHLSHPQCLTMKSHFSHPQCLTMKSRSSHLCKTPHTRCTIIII